ncbi:putative zinc-binding metallopeptidase [Rathayibacter sp. VKM Ac-2856]|uniref:zinc-binding metallopeptidase family protein n=1 Tax=unclassified Rathayibacter TaxID=2609250 RepID=UPI001567A3BB|nr:MULTISPECIES: putative zinc-binding metallopeptidase [unclassified Rathayibacter]NQX05565.1 putative zinc-binding metallopeptidase [Rathayibacter sp. VKM Ac-2858]NQX20560.1 putative zinc-binding metallopeptidase [Rathayibacter sp. VKM Ac-2856]
MRVFGCPHCEARVEFEDAVCLRCGTALAYDVAADELVEAEGRALCVYRGTIDCTWLAAEGTGGACASCALTRARPPVYDAATLSQLTVAEFAKRRLLRQLRHLDLPVDQGRRLSFELLSSAQGSVTTGHADGVITVDLAEGDDAHREALKARLGEPYRTMLGHFRHEIGHYYWQLLVDGTPLLPAFRELFGDERADYGAALDAHYGGAATEDWARDHISQYATTHPWEDFAETFAHYLHIADALETTATVGLTVAGPWGRLPESLVGGVQATGAERISGLEMPEILARWHGFSLALNSVNRSMGKDDLYPFVITPAIAEKLAWVHELVRRGG